MVAVGWYLRYGLSYRDGEELLAERGITVEHVTIYRWVQRFPPRVIDAARPCRRSPGDRSVRAGHHGRVKSRLRPMRGLTRLPSARVISAGYAGIQNIRRGH
ncbi:MAG: hypothetical protein JO309_04055, partial [Pseudonocardiales bacterium]|nr:hypothetical protein [Pseudonocardiales bacterium]